MRSQRSASFMKWVEMKMVTPSRRASSIISARTVARHRVHARGGLVQDQQLRLVHHGHGQRQALAHAQRQALGQAVAHRLQAEALRHLGHARGISASGTWNRRACSTRFWRTLSSP
jgi:MOSC domain-containing protein YiiM